MVEVLHDQVVEQVSREVKVIPDNGHQILHDDLTGKHGTIWRVSLPFQMQVKRILIGQSKYAENHPANHFFVLVITLRYSSLKQVHALTLHAGFSRN